MKLRLLHVAAVLAALALAPIVTGCGGGGEETSSQGSPAALAMSLLPVKQLKPLVLRRTFTWTNPIDYVGQGLFLPEATLPSKAVAVMTDAGFNAAAGQHLSPNGGDPQVYVLAANFGSAAEARTVQSYLHEQDLHAPCAESCSVSPKNYKVSGIPGATAVHQVPNGIKPPPGSQPLENYLLEFPIGSNLYVVDAIGGPGDTPAGRFNAGSKIVYQYAAKHQP